MNRLIYNVVLHTIVAPLMAAYYLPFVALGGKYRRSLGGKLGRLPADFDPARLQDRRIWFHAVSVGEVVALTPLVKAVKKLIPKASIVVSTGTETGQDKARESIPEADGFLYLPLDFPAFVNRVVETIQPDLFVLMETELWPNLIHSLKASGTRIALANGRISDRSFPRYKKLKSLFSRTLESIDLFLMSSESDGQRIAEMGAPRERIVVTGNTKFDAALEKLPAEAGAQVRRMFGLDDSARVLVAGSTHPGEHEIVLDAYAVLAAKYPDLVLILVPRHVEKTPLIQSALRSRHMGPAFLRSAVDSGELRGDRRIIIVDRIGELFRVYSVASVVFMGGSLVPRGGQNIVEPAAWGKMVLFGPSMEDFREAREILIRTGAGIEVTGARDLAARIDEILSDPETYETLAGSGGREIFKHVGSARKNAESLSRLLGTT
jgi:3-deoxy-D-manno-octulosonic-acid transferase